MKFDVNDFSFRTIYVLEGSMISCIQRDWVRTFANDCECQQAAMHFTRVEAARVIDEDEGEDYDDMVRREHEYRIRH